MEELSKLTHELSSALEGQQFPILDGALIVRALLLTQQSLVAIQNKTDELDAHVGSEREVEAEAEVEPEPEPALELELDEASLHSLHSQTSHHSHHSMVSKGKVNAPRAHSCTPPPPPAPQTSPDTQAFRHPPLTAPPPPRLAAAPAGFLGGPGGRDRGRAHHGAAVAWVPRGW